MFTRILMIMILVDGFLEHFMLMFMIVTRVLLHLGKSGSHVASRVRIPMIVRMIFKDLSVVDSRDVLIPTFYQIVVHILVLPCEILDGSGAVRSNDEATVIDRGHISVILLESDSSGHPC